MIRTLDAVSAHRTTNLRPVWSPSFVPCPCVLMRAGTRSSSTCPTSRDAPTVPTISRLCVSRSTPTAESEEFTSPIAFTPRTNCHLSSSSSCPLPARLRLERWRDHRRCSFTSRSEIDVDDDDFEVLSNKGWKTTRRRSWKGNGAAGAKIFYRTTTLTKSACKHYLYCTFTFQI